MPNYLVIWHEILSYFSTWHQLKKMVVRCIRFFSHLNKKNLNTWNAKFAKTLSENINVKQMHLATLRILCYNQQRHLPLVFELVLDSFFFDARH